MKHEQSWANVPSGTVSVHVRHGDKASEMQLLPNDHYVEQAEEILRVQTGMQRILFLSTDDPNTVLHFKQLQDWTVLTADIERPETITSSTHFAMDIGPDKQMLNG